MAISINYSWKLVKIISQQLWSAQQLKPLGKDNLIDESRKWLTFSMSCITECRVWGKKVHRIMPCREQILSPMIVDSHLWFSALICHHLFRNLNPELWHIVGLCFLLKRKISSRAHVIFQEANIRQGCSRLTNPIILVIRRPRRFYSYLNPNFTHTW